MEVDIGWDRRSGEIGGGSDWLEILGSGMVHPRVLANCGHGPAGVAGLRVRDGRGARDDAEARHAGPAARSTRATCRWLRHYGFDPLASATLHEGDRRMKFTLSWLRTHLDTDATLDAITDRLTGIGLELEGVEAPGAALAAFRVAAVTEAVQHPNADRLRVCTVDTGDGLATVVCGAPNARAGMKAVFAPPGSIIPGLNNTVLKIGEIRGVQSAGMLLSYREMGLGEDHDGIADLPGDAPVGTPYPDYAGLDDPVIEIAVTPNRGDALGVRGVARDLAASGLGTLKPWSVEPVAGSFPSPVGWVIASPACPWVLRRDRAARNPPARRAPRRSGRRSAGYPPQRRSGAGQPEVPRGAAKPGGSAAGMAAGEGRSRAATVRRGGRMRRDTGGGQEPRVASHPAEPSPAAAAAPARSRQEARASSRFAACVRAPRIRAASRAGVRRRGSRTPGIRRARRSSCGARAA